MYMYNVGCTYNVYMYTQYFEDLNMYTRYAKFTLPKSRVWNNFRCS